MERSDTYDHGNVVEYWQWAWDREEVYSCRDPTDPVYVLGMFPYPSGRLHMGHVRNYAITDAIARFERMRGRDVVHPMGWDAFGLPAENAARERGTDPASWTDACIQRMREEMETLGFGFDWDREIRTADPDYYRWNQWLFRQLHEAGLLTYEGAPVNWCPECETVLADAQVVGGSAVDPDGGSGTCWRCSTPVRTRTLDQWFVRITEYADELLAGLDDLDGWADGVRAAQREWIGRREGTRVEFPVREGPADSIEVFTRRLDTIAGATFVAVSPDHDLARTLAERDDAIAEAIADLAPGAGPSAGVETPVVVENPATGDQLPVYVAAYVLGDVGTGAVMGVPAHDEQAHAFAEAHDRPMEVVVERTDESDGSENESVDDSTGDSSADRPMTDPGVVQAPDSVAGMDSATASDRLQADLAAAEAAERYRLRDWLISRQRYWGTPIPVVHCPDCGPVPVPESDLPVELPEYVETTGNPLDAAEEWRATTCPDCGGPAERETDTMDTFVDSSWYFLRYCSPDYEAGPFDPDAIDECLPVDVYVGGTEHAVLHLLYLRFVAHAMADLDLLDDPEPIERLLAQGTVLSEGQKMAETAGNAIAPHEYGPETTRIAVLDAAHPRRDFEWSAVDVGDAYDLVQKVYGLVYEYRAELPSTERSGRAEAGLDRAIDRVIAATTDAIERYRFHDAVAEIRRLADHLTRYRAVDTPDEATYRRGLSVLVRLAATMAPYLAEECWNLLRADGLVASAEWPTPGRDIDDYDRERSLIDRTRADVRDILETASIDDPDQIAITVAPEWAVTLHRAARESSSPDLDDLVETLDDPPVDRGTIEVVASDLLDRHRRLEPVFDADREVTVLDRAAWRLADEFDAAVEVRSAADAPREQALAARPGRPAIRID